MFFPKKSSALSKIAFTISLFFMASSQGFINDWFDIGCDWNSKDPGDAAILTHERLSTPLPKGLFRQVNPFKESDFFTKPWMRQFEYVIVVNNSSPFLHYRELPNKMPLITQPLSSFGIVDVTQDNAFSRSHISMQQSLYNAKNFLQTFENEANKIKKFGEIIYEKNSRGEMMPKKSGLPETQTIRIYRNGQLIRMAKISTGRGSFQKRGRKPHCEQPFQSYHTFTEPGYYTFQELHKEYRSKSYDAEMPNALFYNVGRGLALHEVFLSSKIGQLGTPASGGCTRMDPDTAQNLFQSVQNTSGARIPMIDVYGNPVLNSSGEITFKSSEEIIYEEGTIHEQRRQTGNAYSALLIIQPDPVVDAKPYNDKATFFRYKN